MLDIESQPDDTVSPEELVQTLADASLRYVTAHEQEIRDVLWLYLDGGYELPDEAEEFLSRIDGVETHNIAVPLVFEKPLHHTTYQRVPLYIDENHRELSPVDVATGAENLRTALRGEWEPDPTPSETVRLERLLEELADAGASSVIVMKNPLRSGEPVLEIVVAHDADTVYETTGTYREAIIEDECYPLSVSPTIAGPNIRPGRITLYRSKEILGYPPVSIEDGVASLKKWLAEETKSAP